MKDEQLAVFPTINDAAKATGINGTLISLVIKKTRSSAEGFWEEGYGPLHIDLSRYVNGQALSAQKGNARLCNIPWMTGLCESLPA